jgi:hypothetical protein
MGRSGVLSMAFNLDKRIDKVREARVLSILKIIIGACLSIMGYTNGISLLVVLGIVVVIIAGYGLYEVRNEGSS